MKGSVGRDKVKKLVGSINTYEGCLSQSAVRWHIATLRSAGI